MGKSDIVISDLIEHLNTKDKAERMAIFIWGVLIYSIAFSIFFSPMNIVTGGSTGLSLIFRDVLGIDPSTTVFIISFILLVIGYFLLGKYNTVKTVFGVILLPIFMKFSSTFQNFFDMNGISLFITVCYGGIMMGLGNGMII